MFIKVKGESDSASLFSRLIIWRSDLSPFTDFIHIFIKAPPTTFGNYRVFKIASDH